MKYYITKYALTTGIISASSEEARECNNGLLDYRPEHANFSTYLHGEGKEWHKSWEDAVTRAEDMRKRKIDSLKSSILKMEKLKFKAPE